MQCSDEINVYIDNSVKSPQMLNSSSPEDPLHVANSHHDVDLQQLDQMITESVNHTSRRDSIDSDSGSNHKKLKTLLSEKDDLAMIAEQLEHATSSTTTNDHNPPAENHHISSVIPQDLELFKTSTAYQAYAELSHQMPPLAVLASAHLAALPLPIVAATYLPPRIQLLINTLPTLDNLASQLLRIITVGPYQHIIDVASKPDTPEGAAFRDLTSLFEFTKRLYSEDDPFLLVEHLAPGLWKEGEPTPSMFRNREQSIELTLRKVNLATFLAAVLGTIDVGFFYLNESFLSVFCPCNDLLPENALSNMGSTNLSLQSGINYAVGDRVGKLLKPQLALYLELKTQAYISAMEAGERLLQEIINDIFPPNLLDQLCDRRKTKKLSHIELLFVEQCTCRRDQLLAIKEVQQLSAHYEWFVFLKDLFDHVLQNMGFLIWGRRGKVVRKREKAETNPHSLEVLSGNEPLGGEEKDGDRLDEMTMAKNLAPSAADYEKLQEISSMTNTMLPLEIQQMQLHLRLGTKPGAPRSFSRRPWTLEEERALRQALELKGPLWLTILELYGNGGKILEALKGRLQVQIKDKARNWKIFFLKLGLPIPDYLKGVTGDLDRDDKNKTKRLPALRKTSAAPVPLVVAKK